MRRIQCLAVVVCLICVVSKTQAARVPDAGQLLRQQQQTPSQLPQQLPPTENTQQPPGVTDDSVKIAVSAFEFSGIEGVVSVAELQQVVQSFIGRTLGIAELQSVVDLVTSYLRKKGFFLARAYLPQQEITNGVVKIAVTVGQVEGKPAINVVQPARIKPQVIANLTDIGVHPGAALQQKELERSLLLINDLPGVSARSILEKGETAGSTKVTVEARENSLLNGTLSLDNFGNRFTGEFQTSAYAAANDITGYGDQLSTSITGADGLLTGNMNYIIPLGFSGLKARVGYTGLKYELGKEFDSLDCEGTANTATVDLRYPIMRSRSFSLWQSVTYEYRKLKDEVGNDTVKERTLNVVSTSVTVDKLDHFGGGGITNFNIELVYGDLNLGVAADKIIDAYTAKAAGDYVKLSYTLSRLQRLNDDFSLFGSVSGQIANSNLDSSEKYVLGGAYGVRAYPIGEAAGDEGVSFTSELRYNLPRKILASNLQLVTFADAGHITLHNSTWTNSVDTATGENDYWLYGAGVGVNLDLPGTYAIRISYAHALGSNPGRSITDKNADNQSDDGRFWLQGIIWF